MSLAQHIVFLIPARDPGPELQLGTRSTAREGQRTKTEEIRHKMCVFLTCEVVSLPLGPDTSRRKRRRLQQISAWNSPRRKHPPAWASHQATLLNFKIHPLISSSSYPPLPRSISLTWHRLAFGAAEDSPLLVGLVLPFSSESSPVASTCACRPIAVPSTKRLHPGLSAKFATSTLHLSRHSDRASILSMHPASMSAWQGSYSTSDATISTDSPAWIRHLARASPDGSDQSNRLTPREGCVCVADDADDADDADAMASMPLRVLVPLLPPVPLPPPPDCPIEQYELVSSAAVRRMA